MSSCLSSSRLKMRTSATSASSSRRTMVDPNEPVPPVTSTVACDDSSRRFQVAPQCTQTTTCVSWLMSDSVFGTGDRHPRARGTAACSGHRFDAQPHPAARSGAACRVDAHPGRSSGPLQASAGTGTWEIKRVLRTARPLRLRPKSFSCSFSPGAQAGVDDLDLLAGLLDQLASDVLDPHRVPHVQDQRLAVAGRSRRPGSPAARPPGPS